MRRIFLLLLFFALPAHADDFVFRSLQGAKIKLSAYRGKWVLVNFWSPSDAASRSEIPELVALDRAHRGKDLVLIGIAMNSGDAKTVQDFAAANRIAYPIVLGNEDIADQIGGIAGLPANLLYNPSGDLVAAKTGPITRENVERLIR